MLSMVGVVQARLGSTRFPGKVLTDLGGEALLGHVVRRVSAVVNEVVLAVPIGMDDQPLVDWALAHGVPCVRGSRDDVLARFEAVAQAYHTADTFVRFTADCPLLDVGVSKTVIGALTDDLDIVHTGPEVDGLDTEVFTRAALMQALRYAQGREREHVTPWMREHLRAKHVRFPGIAPTRWSVDTPEDADFVRRVFAACRHCAEGTPHHANSASSIGGADRSPRWDLHAVEDTGGVGLAECTAYEIRVEDRGVWVAR